MDQIEAWRSSQQIKWIWGWYSKQLTTDLHRDEAKGAIEIIRISEAGFHQSSETIEVEHYMKAKRETMQLVYTDDHCDLLG